MNGVGATGSLPPHGRTRLAGFGRLRAAVRRGDWQLAAAEALDSRWASQTGHRASEVAAMLRGDGDGN